jgi:hypothetical protein
MEMLHSADIAFLFDVCEFECEDTRYSIAQWRFKDEEASKT